MSFYRKLFRYGLSKIEFGVLHIEEQFAGGINYAIAGKNPGYEARMVVKDPHCYKHVVLFGEIGFGEAYVEALWESEDLNLVLRWFAENRRQMPGFSGAGVSTRFLNLMGVFNRIKHFFRPNTQRISRKNISEHYDLGNPFYELMLERSMAYSCGVFNSQRDTLTQAQENKFALLCAKLQLKKTDHVLEIGSGWGGFAIYAARKFGCKIKTITISEKQFEYAQDKIRAAKLNHLIDIELIDYRNLTGSYDKIISIEMAEAIGYKYFDTYFGQCARLLKPDGLAVLQYITYPEALFEQYLKNTDFSQIYIFPGSCLLSNLEVLKSMHRTGDLLLQDLETIGQHYVTTLRRWRGNVEKHKKTILTMGYSETFFRKWIYYLTFCEAGFAERAINDVQVVFARANSKKYGDYHEKDKTYFDIL